MALVKADLQSALESWMNNPVDNLSDGIDGFVNAYDTYALQAIDISGDNPLVVNKATMKSTLLALPPVGTPSSAALIFENAVISYWTGATFALTTPPPGGGPEISALVTTPPAVGSIQSGLQTVFSDVDAGTTVASKANDIANTLDTATKAVIDTITYTNLAAPPPTLVVAGAIS